MGWETGCQREIEHDMSQTLQLLVNFGKNHGTLGWLIFCLSITFSTFSFLDTGKPKHFHPSDLKVTGASAVSRTLSLGFSSPLFRVQRMMGTHGDCSVHDCSLCFTAAEINFTFYPDKPVLLKRVTCPRHHHNTFATAIL